MRPFGNAGQATKDGLEGSVSEIPGYSKSCADSEMPFSLSSDDSDEPASGIKWVEQLS
jgi:hypothetical protein